MYSLSERVDKDGYVIFIAFCYPKGENAHKNINNWSNSPKKLSTKSTHGFYIKIDPFHFVFVVGKGRYGRICDFYSILLPEK